MLLYAVLASLGFGALYAESALAHAGSPPAAWIVGVIASILFAAAFLAPPQLLRFTNADVAPRVMSRVVARAGISSLLVLVTSAVVWFLVGRGGVALLQELYVYALLAIVLFFGFGGAAASHVFYLQQTKQYNSNQLVAVLVLVTLLLLVLLLYFLAFDYAFPRDDYVHVRDLTAVTLVLLGYGRALYLMAHH